MKFKVCTCWDDGVVNDIRLAGLFRKYGAKATFNLNPGLLKEERTESRWADPLHDGWACRGFCTGKLALRDVPEVYAGFELASHCWRHENAGSIPDADWIKAALDARHWLEDVAQKPCLGFAWPCGISTPGTVAALRAAGFAYGRSTKTADDVLRDNPEPMTLKSNCHFQDTRRFWSCYKAARESGGVFYFWGHSYEMMDYDRFWEQMENALRYIAEDPDAEWIDVVDAARLVSARNAGAAAGA
ncbi:MAG: polysaccharide deacetylase family protein [Kiritimatiellae bacterium]|nr:polysaccharide deacetylase family protein [Kiritimatiellia bacterium]